MQASLKTADLENYTVKSKRVANAFDKSIGQVYIADNGTEKFVIGSFGMNKMEREPSIGHFFFEKSELPSVLESEVARFRGSADKRNFRFHNTIHVGKLPNGDTGFVVTRKNRNGDMEIINWFRPENKIKESNYMKQLESFGAPGGN